MLERRNDCEYFELKKHSTQTGECETDGHYLCSNCKHIANPEAMSYGDIQEKYYPEYTALTLIGAIL